MTYEETVNYLFNCAPLFQQVGSSAYKEGLENTMLLDNRFGHPHRKYHTIHIAGTNGKGSTSHTIASILQAAGHKTGLYTSPHLVDFRERIRVNGTPIEKEFVISFVKEHKDFFEPLHPSFFELTTAMAFHYFATQNIDVAVIEVGLGGRLDCTNIISPDISIITNISLDHTQFLGNRLTEIAHEKAGIIKPGTPVVIGETTEETKKVFTETAKKAKAPIFFAEEEKPLSAAVAEKEGFRYSTIDYGEIHGELGGSYQTKNSNTVLTALRILKKSGYKIDKASVVEGFRNVTRSTGLMGRWQTIGHNPRIICDAGHNIGGIEYVTKQLSQQKYRTMRIIFGMVNDKDIRGVLSLMPKNATYYFTRASVKRALNEKELANTASTFGLNGVCCPNVHAALSRAKKEASPDDLIFIGGSCFIVADLLSDKES